MIDANYLRNKGIRNCPIEDGGIPLKDFATHQKILDLYPTIDAIEVVRCKDCKFYMAETEERCNALKSEPFGLCLRERQLSEADYREQRNWNDFCSRGKRRESDG